MTFETVRFFGLFVSLQSAVCFMKPRKLVNHYADREESQRGAGRTQAHGHGRFSAAESGSSRGRGHEHGSPPEQALSVHEKPTAEIRGSNDSERP